LNDINNGVSPLETEMYEVLAEAEKINGGMATEYQQEQFNQEFSAEAINSANAQERLINGVGKGATEDTLTNLNNWLQR
jgi:hypothetical protein